MAVVTSDFLAAVMTNFHALWADQFLAGQLKQIRQRLATEVPSDTSMETYAWLGTVPKMREWLAERQLGGLTAHNYSITNKHFESSIEVDRDTFEDDKLGMIRPRIQQLALEATRYEDELTIAALPAGLTSLDYDGQYFFDTDHVDPGAVYQTNQSNKLSGSGVTLTALQTDYAAARAAMQLFKDGEGRAMNIMPTTIVAPPALEGVFRQLLNGDFFPTVATGAATTAPNIWKGTAELIISPYLTDVNDWYLLALDQPVKPLIFQMRKAPEFVALDNPRDIEAFLRRRFMYGVDARYNVGYSMWQLAVVTTN